MAWAKALASNQELTGLTFESFSRRLRSVFDHPDHLGSTLTRLLSLPWSVMDYSVKFWTLAAVARWNKEALRGVFVQGLNESIKEELVAREDPSSLNDLVSLAFQLDHHLRDCHRERQAVPGVRESTSSPSVSFHPTSSSVKTMEAPMQLRRAPLSPAEWNGQFSSGSCLYCGGGDHFISLCLILPKAWARQ